MHLRLQYILALTIIFLQACTVPKPYHDSEHRLYYEKPASAWEEKLPVGNGRMGMMPDGDPFEEHIILNEISMWSGCETDYANPDAAESLKDIRTELLAGRNAEAQKIMYERFVPKKDTEGGTYGTYQVLGQLIIRHHYDDSLNNGDYRRCLDLREATNYVSYSRDGTGYTKKYYVSRADDVMIVEISATEPEAVNLDIELDRAGKAEESLTEEGYLKFTGTLDSGCRKKGMKYAAYAGILAEGRNQSIEAVDEENPCIKVRKAGRVWIIISASTDYSGHDHDSTAYARLAGMTRKKIRSAHKRSIASHQDLYFRNCLSLGGNEEYANVTTDKRIVDFAQGGNDNSLAALYYNFGRYLLICSTRPGGLPPNLQGLWANTFHTPWNGDYHTNINVQMNHWIAESGNLPELHEPLIDMVLRMVPSGTRTARDFYGRNARGWVQHMMTNVWNYTAPGEHPSWGATNTGGAWLCAHLWEHYLYNGDSAYLERIYPVMKGASDFFLSTMIREPMNGWLVTSPSSSPENSFIIDTKEGRKAVSICMGPTMDIQLVRELFGNTIEAAGILERDPDYADSLRTAISMLPPNRISDKGYLMEWMEDYPEAEPQHRHVSHLYGLYPGCQISPSKTPELAEACKVTLNRRGDEATGWSRAWKINFWARLGDGDRALKLLRSLLAPAAYRNSSAEFCNDAGSYPNMLCAHPPFQIDGNFGGAAGISEMLVQSNEGFINLLPALPKEWTEGEIRGLKVRGGATIDLKWTNGRPTSLTIVGGWIPDNRIRIPEGSDADYIEITLKKGRRINLTFNQDQ